MCIPNRNAKEYYMDNKGIIDDKNKQWRENHKDKVKEYKMNYRQINKEMLNTKAKIYREANNEIIKEQRTQPIVCECGTTVNKWCISRHRTHYRSARSAESFLQARLSGILCVDLAFSYPNPKNSEYPQNAQVVRLLETSGRTLNLALFGTHHSS